MKINGNILVLTQWSFKDALIQTYTLPYVEILRETIPPDRKIIVVTAEQEKKALSEDELAEVNKQWEKRNMELIAQPYRRYGWKKIIAGIGQIANLYKVVSLVLVFFPG